MSEVEEREEGSIDVLVQLGDERWTTKMHIDTIWQELDAFERGPTRKRKDRLPAFTRKGLVLASFQVLNAMSFEGAHEVCVAALWIFFRRPAEIHKDYEATCVLNDLIHQHGGARIIVVGDESAGLESFQWYIVEPDMPDDDPRLDLRPRTNMM